MGVSSQVQPNAPTSSLPPLGQLASYTLDRIAEALSDLQIIYIPNRSLQQNILLKSKHLPNHLIHDTSVPDSGYASEADDDEEDDSAIDLLRADSCEREFAIRWLTGFTARSDTWVYSCDEEEDARTKLVDDAAALLASFAGEDDDAEEEGLTRRFTFPIGKDGRDCVEAELNDAPLLSNDHTSVGLQSWASSILLSERMCRNPDVWGFLATGMEEKRVLELGAGTGLLSIVATKLMQSSPHPRHIIATDFHPAVLDNLRLNIRTNFPSFVSSPPVEVLKLDWQYPEYHEPLDKPFDVILAADVVYHPEHAQWIKSCVERLLLRPSPSQLQEGGVLWLIMAVRSTGRHEGLNLTVTTVFPPASTVAGDIPQLAALNVETIKKQGGLGRMDESAYLLFKIGWVLVDMNKS